MSILAVIVTYFPSIRLFDNINDLSCQVDHILVVDNNSGSSCRLIFEKLRDNIDITVIYLKENLGIASALNIGVRYAIDHKYQWVLTLDQDSRVSPGMIFMMFDAYEECDKKNIVAILSPRYKDQYTGLVWGNNVTSIKNDPLPFTPVQCCITSGSLLKTSVLSKIGFFDESYFIDYVDIEFCLRCSNFGFIILQINQAILLHSIGNFKINKMMWMRPISTNHSPVRRYYFVRNAIFTYRKFLFTHTKWVLNNFCVLIKTIVVIVIFEDRVFDKIRAISFGFIDGLFKKTGKCMRNIK